MIVVPSARRSSPLSIFLICKSRMGGDPSLSNIQPSSPAKPAGLPAIPDLFKPIFPLNVRNNNVRDGFSDICFSPTQLDKTISSYTESGKLVSVPLSQILEATQAKGIVFDVDDCLIKSEDTQVKVWKETFYEWANELGRGDDTAAIKAICDSLEESFRTGDMDGLMRGIYNTADRFGLITSEINTVPALEEYLKEKRIPLLIKHCLDGDIRLNDGVADMLRCLHNLDIKMGIFTSAPKEITAPILDCLLSQENLSFNTLIPQENRVFGPDVSRNKPDPEGWITAARKMGINFNDVLIADDRLNVLMEVAKGHSFGSPAGVIGLCPPKSRLQWERNFLARQDFGSKTWAILLSDDFSNLSYNEE